MQTSSGIVASNFTDNSISSIVLSDLCYNSITDSRITLNTNDVVYNSPLYHTFYVNNSNVLTIGENDIDVYGNIVSVADITTIGNINCNTLNSIGISNYLTNNILTDNSIGDIVVDNVCYADVVDPRITLNVNDTNITAPTNLNLKVGNTTIATLNSTQTQDNFTVNGVISADTIGATTISANSFLLASVAQILVSLDVPVITNHYNSTQIDDLLTAKQDTTTGLTNLLTTALCQYPNHLTINELQITEPSEALRVSGNSNFDGDVNITGSLTAGSITPPYFCAGKVNSTGSIQTSEGRIGFTVIKTGTGVYQINFNSANPDINYIIMITVNSGADGSGRVANYGSVSVNSFTVYVKGGSGLTTAYDRSFCFIVAP